MLSLASNLCAQIPQLPQLKAAAPQAAQMFQDAASTGMVILLVRDGDVLFQTYGETAPGSGKPPTADSLLRLCSLSKLFTADLLVKLSLDGTVSLTSPLQSFAPPHVLVPSRTRRGKADRGITLTDLATHTSGLPREVGAAPAGTPHFTFPDYAYRWRWLPRQTLRSSPGRAALYSNVGFDLLGDALQTAAGKPYATLLAERTTAPLNLRETTFTPTPNQCARLLIGTDDPGPCTDTQASAGSSGLYSTANDMIRWLRYLLGLPGVPTRQAPSAQAVYILPTSLASVSGLDHAGPPSGIGLAWMHLGPAGDPAEVLEKTGGGAGFSTYIALNPAHHTGIFVAATDGPGQSHKNLFQSANDLLMFISGQPPTSTRRKGQTSACTGCSPQVAPE